MCEQSLTINHKEAIAKYETFVASRQEEIETREVEIAAETRGANTVTKFVQGYTGMTFATYANTGDSGNGCTIISGVNVCMYWANCRGKSGLYSSVPGTYSALKSYIDVSSSLGAKYTDACNGSREYMNSKGYLPSMVKITCSEWTWSNMKAVIDANRPIIFASEIFLSGGAYSGLAHAVTVMGYQYIEVENTIMIADCYSTNIIYKTFSSIPHCIGTEAFSYYPSGW